MPLPTGNHAFDLQAAALYATQQAAYAAAAKLVGYTAQQSGFTAADISYYQSRRALELSFGFATVDTDAALAGLGVGPIPAT